MHRLQQRIIGKLMMNPPLRYSDLKPKLTEGNLFTYHLKKLINDGLVRKSGDRYELTATGKLRADRISLATFSEPMQPKIVTIIIGQNGRGEQLLYRRDREPFRGKVGFPHGKVHLGETIFQAAERELREKTGLAASFKHRGDVYAITFQDGDLVSQVLFHVFTATGFEGELISKKTKAGQAFWRKIELLDQSLLSPGVNDIYQLVKTNPAHLFFAEFTYQL